MKEQEGIVHVGPRGELKGLSIIGCHGELDHRRGPARRQPIWTDTKGRIVELLAIGEVSSRGPRSVVVERGSRLGPEDSIPGIATRFPPVAARLDDVVMGIGPNDRAAIEHLPVRHVEMGELLIAIVQPEEAAAICTAVAARATEHLLRAVHSANKVALIDAAWWLSRAGTRDEDWALAVAALEWAHSPHAETLWQASFRGRQVNREELLRIAHRRIDDGTSFRVRPEEVARNKLRARFSLPGDRNAA